MTQFNVGYSTYFKGVEFLLRRAGCRVGHIEPAA